MEHCINEPDDARRLACYDQVFRRSETPVAPEAAASVPSAQTPPMRRLPTVLDSFWELTPEHKRGTFSVRTYLPNFVLPLHYTVDPNPAPASPTRSAVPRSPNDKPVDVKLQISLRAKIAEGLFLPNADLWFAYTGHSGWQLWNQADSSPFRNTDYQPEAIYVVPISERINILPAGWRWRMVQLGLVHQSNGQTEPLSRSWNRVYLAGRLQSRRLRSHGTRGEAARRFERRQPGHRPIRRQCRGGGLVGAWPRDRPAHLAPGHPQPEPRLREVRLDLSGRHASSRAGCAGMCNCSPATAKHCWTTTTAKPASGSGWRCSSSSRMGRAWSCTELEVNWSACQYSVLRGIGFLSDNQSCARGLTS